MTKVVAVLGIAALAVACSQPAQIAAPAATEHCDAPERPTLQGGDHLIGDREPPVPYSSTPPTSGWHASGAFDIAVQPQDDPLSEPEQVSVLEAGAVVVTYRELADADRIALETHARQYAGRIAVTPYEKLREGEVAFTGWGALQRCEALDLAALDQFVKTYADEQPSNPGDQ